MLCENKWQWVLFDLWVNFGSQIVRDVIHLSHKGWDPAWPSFKLYDMQYSLFLPSSSVLLLYFSVSWKFWLNNLSGQDFILPSISTISFLYRDYLGGGMSGEYVLILAEMECQYMNLLTSLVKGLKVPLILYWTRITAFSLNWFIHPIGIIYLSSILNSYICLSQCSANVPVLQHEFD